jgi:hypothetical protein
LYKERELVELRQRYAGYVAPSSSSEDDDAPRSGPPSSPPPPRVSTAPPVASGGVTKDMFAELELEVATLRSEVSRVREELRDLQRQLGVTPMAGEPLGE